ncbi:hypothetical protein AC293_06765 [Salmonella enterica subsp. enterica serovar Virchow]|nr:hypothetical protein [Salmonella enterica subsp. enterica serovar Aberdeen]EBD4664330.1 hypothetical protein [Salmonella enterica]ECO1502283.1 hypothetical protein [Salmonella enterica subsp. enterica serovar Virchow]EAC1243547.1 hypothetical protein [Salmonella enterica subsp. enterica serovar Aberdeen]EBH7084224.1 hypothetical protein [Salmonella enterica]
MHELPLVFFTVFTQSAVGAFILLPWGFRYLELLQRNTVSAFYARLAVVATCYLQDVQQQQGLQPENKRLFF